MGVSHCQATVFGYGWEKMLVFVIASVWESCTNEQPRPPRSIVVSLFSELSRTEQRLFVLMYSSHLWLDTTISTPELIKPRCLDHSIQFGHLLKINTKFILRLRPEVNVDAPLERCADLQRIIRIRCVSSDYDGRSCGPSCVTADFASMYINLKFKAGLDLVRKLGQVMYRDRLTLREA